MNNRCGIDINSGECVDNGEFNNEKICKRTHKGCTLLINKESMNKIKPFFSYDIQLELQNIILRNDLSMHEILKEIEVKQLFYNIQNMYDMNHRYNKNLIQKRNDIHMLIEQYNNLEINLKLIIKNTYQMYVEKLDLYKICFILDKITTTSLSESEQKSYIFKHPNVFTKIKNVIKNKIYNPLKNRLNNIGSIKITLKHENKYNTNSIRTNLEYLFQMNRLMNRIGNMNYRLLKDFQNIILSTLPFLTRLNSLKNSNDEYNRQKTKVSLFFLHHVIEQDEHLSILESKSELSEILLPFPRIDEPEQQEVFTRISESTKDSTNDVSIIPETPPKKIKDILESGIIRNHNNLQEISSIMTEKSNLSDDMFFGNEKLETKSKHKKKEKKRDQPEFNKLKKRDNFSSKQERIYTSESDITSVPDDQDEFDFRREDTLSYRLKKDNSWHLKNQDNKKHHKISTLLRRKNKNDFERMSYIKYVMKTIMKSSKLVIYLKNTKTGDIIKIKKQDVYDFLFENPEYIIYGNMINEDFYHNRD